MANTFELQISRLLGEKGDVELVADQLLKDWQSGAISSSDSFIVADFLINAGLFSSLVDFIDQLIANNRLVPWPQYVRLLQIVDASLHAETLHWIFTGATTQNQQGFILSSPLFSELPEVVALKSSRQKSQHQTQESQRQHLVERILFLRSQRLIAEEGKSLKELAELSPENLTYQEMRHDYDLRWAVHLISQQSQARKETYPTLIENDKVATEPILNSALSSARKDPSLAVDLALALLFLDAPEKALAVITLAENSTTKDWLYLDLLIESRRFLEALEKIDSLEVKYANDPETSFAASYARAKSYWGLKQSEKAIEIINGLVNIRPSYRSAYALLHQWRGEIA